MLYLQNVCVKQYKDRCVIYFNNFLAPFRFIAALLRQILDVTYASQHTSRCHSQLFWGLPYQTNEVVDGGGAEKVWMAATVGDQKRFKSCSWYLTVLEIKSRCGVLVDIRMCLSPNEPCHTLFSCPAQALRIRIAVGVHKCIFSPG